MIEYEINMIDFNIDIHSNYLKNKYFDVFFEEF